MKSYLCALLLMSAGVTLTVPQAMAQEAAKTTKKTTAPAAAKKPAKKTAAKKATPKAGTAAAAAAAHDPDDDIVPDIAGSTNVEYHCELGNKVTIYENQTDPHHVALKLNNKTPHRLKRVSTTTGASRFENKKHGLVWIGIPAKGILLDSKKGQQLANECKNADQMMPTKEKTAALESGVQAHTSQAPAALTSGSAMPVQTGSMVTTANNP